MTSSFACIASPSLPSAIAISPAFKVLPLLLRPISAPWPQFRRRVSASRSPPTQPSPSCIRMCWAAGAAPAPRSSTFSPLADEPPPEDCDACWLPGGYPELHAGTLANAGRFKAGLIRFAASRPVHGECGGYMVLGEGLVDADGARHAMVGLLSHATSFAERRLHLGYRAATLLQDCPLGSAGTRLRGHEFHYASLIEAGSDEPLAELFDVEGVSLGPSGGRRGHVSGAFFHAIAREEGVAGQQKIAKLA